MKSELLFSATAGTIALILASCSADLPVAHNTSDGAISYNVATANQTRALHSYGNTSLPEGFRVWATKQDGSIYIDGDFLKDENSSDNIINYIDQHGTRYWPKDESLYFYAVADGPYNNDDIEAEKNAPNLKPTLFDANESSANKKATVKDYEVKANASEQLDLMYAVQKATGHNNAVNLNFRHALSQICFKAKNENSNVIITIKSITLQNVIKKGTYTLPEESTNSDAINNLVTHGKWELSPTDKTNYTITFENGIDIIFNNSTDLTGGTTGIDKVLNLLPQGMRTYETDEISLKLEIEVFNSTNNNKGEKIYPYDETTENGIIIPLGTDWEEGNRYTYTLIFTEDWRDKNIKDITYTVSADSYNDYRDQGLPIINNHKAVLMRSGDQPLYFATTNIDAEHPTDTGLYFWWGDTLGHEYANESTDFDFCSANTLITSYNIDLNNTENANIWLTDGNLNLAHDAARVHWGGTWRMPTEEDLGWLKNKDNCDWSWDDTNHGFVVVSKSTGGKIFLPAAGYLGDDSGSTNSKKRYEYQNICWIWSSTPDSSRSWAASRLKIYKSTDNSIIFDNGKNGNRWDGFPIRPVSNGPTE